MALARPSDVLGFWFGPDRDEMNSLSYISGRMNLWFGSATDAFIQTQHDCKHLISQLATGENVGEEWLSSRGCLARVILFDQFSRCIYRGTKEAFQYDSLSIAIIKDLLQNQIFHTSEFKPIERFFMCVAIQHSENIDDQLLGVQLASTMASDGPLEIQDYFLNLPGYPYEHYDVIKKFGRFPSRNFAMDRTSTEEELVWMQSPECPKWAKTQLPQLK